MTDQELQERIQRPPNIGRGWMDHLSRVLWKQWGLVIHHQTPLAWRFLREELMPFGFINPAEHPSPRNEVDMAALASMVNQFYMRHMLPIDPHWGLYVNGLDDAVKDYGLAWPDPLPDDWYAFVAAQLGLTQRPDWHEIDAFVQWITTFRRRPFLRDYVWRDLHHNGNRKDINLAITLCQLCEDGEPSDFGEPEMIRHR